MKTFHEHFKTHLCPFAVAHHLVVVPVQRTLLQDKPVSLPFASQEAAALLPAEKPALTVHYAQILDRNPPPAHGCSRPTGGESRLNVKK